MKKNTATAVKMKTKKPSKRRRTKIASQNSPLKSNEVRWVGIEAPRANRSLTFERKKFQVPFADGNVIQPATQDEIRVAFKGVVQET